MVGFLGATTISMTIFSITTFSITILNIIALALAKNETENNTHIIIILAHFSACCYADCHCTDIYKVVMLQSVIIVLVISLNRAIMSLVMLNVVMRQ